MNSYTKQPPNETVAATSDKGLGAATNDNNPDNNVDQLLQEWYSSITIESKSGLEKKHHLIQKF